MELVIGVSLIVQFEGTNKQTLEQEKLKLILYYKSYEELPQGIKFSNRRGMIIKISSVANELTISPLNKFYTALEDRINVFMADESFGPISQLTIVIVAVHDDVVANYFYCKHNNKSGSFIHPFTKNRISYLSIAVPYVPNKVLSFSDTSLREDLCNEIIHTIVKKEVKIPKGFDFNRFSEKIKLGLEKYKKYDL